MDEFQKAFSSPDTFATVLLTIFVDKYGTEGFQWSPETIAMEIAEDFNVQLSQPVFDRLMTAIDLVTSDSFYQSLPDFINQCNILSGDTYDPRTWDPADSLECAWGITEALLLSPPEDDNPFSDEIVGYIGKVLDEEGITNPPDVLKIAVRDKVPTNTVHEFSDDPIMFDSVYALETSKSDDITQALAGGLQRLATQLEALPLRTGNTKQVVKQMLQRFGSTD